MNKRIIKTFWLHNEVNHVPSGQFMVKRRLNNAISTYMTFLQRCFNVVWPWCAHWVYGMSKKQILSFVNYWYRIVLKIINLHISSSFPRLITVTHGLLKEKAPWGRGCSIFGNNFQSNQKVAKYIHAHQALQYIIIIYFIYIYIYIYFNFLYMIRNSTQE